MSRLVNFVADRVKGWFMVTVQYNAEKRQLCFGKSKKENTDYGRPELGKELFYFQPKLRK